MNESIPNREGIDHAQLAEAAVASDAERLYPEISSPLGEVALVAEVSQLDVLQPAEAAEFQANPSIERMKRAERAFFGSPDSLLRQIDDGELGVDDTDFEDRTAIMMMTARGHTEAVRGLIARNADINRINMYQGRIPMSALDAARQANRKDIEQVLLENGAKSGRELKAEQIAAEQNK